MERRDPADRAPDSEHDHSDGYQPVEPSRSVQNGDENRENDPRNQDQDLPEEARPVGPELVDDRLVVAEEFLGITHCAENRQSGAGFQAHEKTPREPRPEPQPSRGFSSRAEPGRGPNSAREAPMAEASGCCGPKTALFPVSGVELQAFRPAGRFTDDDPEGSPPVSRPPTPPVSRWLRVDS